MSLVPPQLSLDANHLSPTSLEPPTPKAWAEPDRGGPSNPYAAYAQTNVNSAMKRLFGSGARPVPDEDWAYERVDNASDCRLLWWLYGAQPPAPREEAPLLVWLEGGPGGSGWEGDLGQVGPLDAAGRARPATWAARANLLFVDSPAGAGFSFCGRAAGLRNSSAQVVADLRAVLAAAYARHPGLRGCPLWVVGQGWGAQTAVRLATALAREADAAVAAPPPTPTASPPSAPPAAALPRPVGVALGSPWLLPDAAVTTFGRALQARALLDGAEAQEVDTLGMQARGAARLGQRARAAGLVDAQARLVANLSGGAELRAVAPAAGAAAWGGSGVAAEGWVRRKLRVVPLAVRWGAQAAAARAALRDELMGECVAPLDALLQAGTGFRALLYAGTRDVAANPLAFEATLRALRSGEGERLLRARKRAHADAAGRVVGFSKRSGGLQAFWLLDAGHAPLADSPTMAAALLDAVLAASSGGGAGAFGSKEAAEEPPTLEEAAADAADSYDLEQDGARLGEADETLDAYRSRRSDLASSWWIERIERGDEAASNEIMSLEGKGHAHAAGS